MTKRCRRLYIADLDSEGGEFYSDNRGVFHFGFDRAELRQAFGKAGFKDMQAITAAEVVKPSPDGTLRRFGIFLMTGVKRG